MTRAELRQRARRQEAFHPVGRGLASPLVPGPRRERGPLPPDVRPAASERQSGPALPLEQAQHRVPAFPPPEERRDVRRAEVRRGGRRAARQACCPEPALRSAQVLLSVPAWWSGQARQVAPSVLRAQEPRALPSAQARAAPRGPLQEAAEALESDVLRQAAAPAAWAPGVLQAVPEAAVSGRAAAGPQPEAVQQASERQAAGVAAAEPDEPQGEAEAVAALQGAPERQPAAAQRAGEAVQPRAAVRPGARARQAAWPLAGPSAAASVFRQGPSLAAGPARPRAAKRLARAMRCWPIASR